MYAGVHLILVIVIALMVDARVVWRENAESYG
jgi:uncharacterized paraquat-inducible protein A